MLAPFLNNVSDHIYRIEVLRSFLDLFTNILEALVNEKCPLFQTISEFVRFRIRLLSLLLWGV